MPILPDFPNLLDIRAVELLSDGPSQFYDCPGPEEIQDMLLQVWGDVCKIQNHEEYVIILKAVDKKYGGIVNYPRSFLDFAQVMVDKYNLLGNKENTF